MPPCQASLILAPHMGGHLPSSVIAQGPAVSVSVLKEATPAPAYGYSAAYSLALTMSWWWALARTMSAACAGIIGDHLSSSYWCSQR